MDENHNSLCRTVPVRKYKTNGGIKARVLYVEIVLNRYE